MLESNTQDNFVFNFDILFALQFVACHEFTGFFKYQRKKKIN